jgi:RNA polymerase sigma-70 factor, ECF subfamily
MLVLHRARGGDAAAIAEFVEQVSPTVYRLVYAMIGSEGIEEIVQETCLELIRRAATRHHGADQKRWLYRTILAAIDNNRGVGREASTLEAFLPKYDTDGNRQGDRNVLSADWSRLPNEKLLSDEGRAIVRGALSRLPIDDRIILLLRDVEELSSEEVADILGLALATIKVRAHRARMALRELLAAVYEPKLRQHGKHLVRARI